MALQVQAKRVAWLIPLSTQVAAGCVPKLVALLALERLGQSDVAIECSSALAMMSIAPEGKAALHECDAVAALTALLAQRDQQLLINVLMCIANAAEYPPLRSQMQASGEGVGAGFVWVVGAPEVVGLTAERVKATSLQPSNPAFNPRPLCRRPTRWVSSRSLDRRPQRPYG